MHRLFFTGGIGDIQHLKVQYASECKVPNERGKGKVWRGFCKPLLRSKAKPSPQKQPVKLNVRFVRIVRFGPKLLRKLLRSA